CVGRGACFEPEAAATIATITAAGTTSAAAAIAIVRPRIGPRRDGGAALGAGAATSGTAAVVPTNGARAAPGAIGATNSVGGAAGLSLLAAGRWGATSVGSGRGAGPGMITAAPSWLSPFRPAAARARTNSLQVAKRSRGSLASARSSARSAVPSRPGLLLDGGGGASWTCFSIVAYGVSPLNGGLPASSS